MGLDIYAASVRPPEDWADADEDLFLAPEAEAALSRAQAEVEKEHDDCVFEGCYFRGKLYQSLLLEITGVNISADWIAPETVRMMADVLSQLDPEEASREYEALSD